MSETHTASVEIQFDFSDETFEFHRINNEIQVTDFIVSGTGFRLLSARLITPTVFLSMSDALIDGDGIYFTQQDLISAVESQFRNVYRVNQLSLKRLDTPFIQSASKRVPVRLVQDLLPADGYAWSSELQIVPDSLTVFGLPSQVDTLMYALLDSPKNKMFNTSFDQKLALTTDLQSNFKWIQTKVYVTQNISRYTQVELRLPVEVIDSDEKVDVSLIPAFVLVNLSVPIERVRQIEPSQFVLVCRLPSDKTTEYLEVNFEKIPEGIMVKDITPKQVRYFLD
ncbi:MAG: hypothetical protein MKZ61_03575 [Flavobacteriales bacterium]|nr:hypothetical protein [Flavobacteriales bacterium]